MRTKLILFMTVLGLGSGCGYNNAYKDIHDLQAQSQRQAAQLAALTTYVLSLEAALSAAIASNTLNIDALQTQYNSTLLTIVSINSAIAALSGQVAVLQSNESVVELLDPCGDMPGQFDEVLLRTSSGKVIAYFETGSKRFLSVLVPNQGYSTTDVQACSFSVNSQGELN